MAKAPKPPHVAPSPRHKQKKIPKSDTPEIQTIDADQSRLSYSIPPDIKMSIADCVIAYSIMEEMALRLIWDIANLSYDDGKILTRFDASDKFEMLRKLIEHHGWIVFHNRQTTLEMWKAIKQLMPVRNLIVHGVWAMLDNSTAISISHRLSSDPGHVLGEPFRLERLQAVVNQCARVKNALERLSETVKSSRAKRRPPHRRD